MSLRRIQAWCVVASLLATSLTILAVGETTAIAQSEGETPSPTPTPTPTPAPAPAPTPEAPVDPTPSADPISEEEAAAQLLGEDGPRWTGRPVERIQFRGNRKVEDDAMRVNLQTRAGGLLDHGKLRDDIRALWKMGFFADVTIEGEIAASGAVTLTFVVAEKPSVRKVLISGNSELELDKINEVIDLELDAIVDVAKIRRNRDKIAELYVGKGFYLAAVDFEIKPANEAEVDVWFNIDEKAKVQIRDVEFIGNKDISDDKLRSIITTQTEGALSFLNDSGTFNQEAFDRDMLVLAAYYWDQGYASVKVGTPQHRLSRDKRYMYVAIPIDEGPVYKVAKVDFRGDLLGTAAEHAAKTRLGAGDTFSRSAIAEDRERVANLYMDQGYAYANVSPMPKFDHAKHTVELTYEVARGKKVFFERISIRGNSKTRDKVIRREMKIAEGELFNNTNLETSKRRINALGFFESVNVTTNRGSSDEFIEVDVQVSERATGTFQIGAGFSSVENFIAQAQISQNNFFGRGQTVALQAQISGLRQLFLARFIEPYFLDSEWNFAIDGYNQSRGFGSFSRNAWGGTLSWGYPLSYEARAFVTYKWEDVSITTGRAGFSDLGATRTPIEAQSVANLFRGGVTSSVRGSLSWDSRNNRLFATEGQNHQVFVEYASEYTGSENRFVRWGGFARYYKELWGPFVLKLNAEVGVTTSTDPLGVPISERYLIGGIFDVRGFRPRSLGPVLRTSQPGDPGQSLTPGGLPLGGNLQVIWNSEIEFPLFKRVGISGVVFFDLGNAYNLEDRYCSGLSRTTSTESPKFDPCFDPVVSLTEGIRRSVGFGFRWQSPIGPLRFEWGIPLDRQADRNEDPLVFEFTIGNFF